MKKLTEEQEKIVDLLRAENLGLQLKIDSFIQLIEFIDNYATERVRNNGVLDDVIVSHLKALTKKIEDSHCYGFEDVLNEYLDSL